MTTIEPLTQYYPEFKHHYLLDVGDGYEVRKNLKLIFPVPIKVGNEIELYHSDKHGFEIRGIKKQGKVVITIEKGLWFDGATFGIDYHTRLIFALAHDCACWASQESKDASYERLFDELSYAIIRKQGGWWFNAWRVQKAVKAWDSFEE